MANSDSKSHSQAHAVGGTLFLVSAKVLFVISAYGIYSGLSHFLTPAQFGIYGLVVNLVSIFNLVVVTGTIQSVSRFVSQAENSEKIKRQALKVLGVLGGLFAAFFFLLAPVIAFLLKDAALSGYFQVSSLIIFFYSFYAVFIGYLNGRKEFRRQGLFDMTYSLVRICFILGLAYWTRSVYGAVSGFACAAFVIVCLAALFVGTGESGGGFELKQFLGFGSVLVGFHLVTNTLMNMDLFMVKALSPAGKASEYAGFYTASLTIARVPSMILQALNLAVFPLVAHAQSLQSTEKIQIYIKNSLRACLIFAVLPAVLIAGDLTGTIRLLYPAAYLQAIPALQVLVWAYILIALFTLTGTAINSLGRASISLGIVFVALLTQMAGAFFLIPAWGITGAAWSTLMGFSLGLTLNIVYLVRHQFYSFSMGLMMKLAGSGVALLVVSRMWPATGIHLLIKDAVLSMAYTVFLFVLKVLSRDELSMLFKKKTEAL